MTIPHLNITPIPNNEPDAVPALWNTRYTEIDENFQNLDTRQTAIESEVIAARGAHPSLPINLSAIDNRISQIEASILGIDADSVAQIKRATQLDWVYRYDRINFEFFTHDYTLIDRAPIGVLAGILGDDSLDVTDTAGMVEGEYYVLSDAVATRLIRVKSILSSQRLRLYESLDKQWAVGATVALHNWSIVAANDAHARQDSIWLAKTINVGDRQGKVVVRRTHNATLVKLFYRAVTDAAWHEAVAVLREVGGVNSADGVPAGFADYEYTVPVAGQIKLRVDVMGGDAVIQHIVAFGLQYLDLINARIDELDLRQVATDRNWHKHYLASQLDWVYRFDRMNYEFFTQDYTLLNKPVIGIREPAVAGDNTIDVGDSSTFNAGDYYLLHDATHTQLIKIAAIHTDNIITIEGVLTRRWDVDSKVSKCNFQLSGPNQALVNHGEQWISKPIAVSEAGLGGFAVIRRTHNTSELRLYWRDATHLDWQEAAGTLRQAGDPGNKDGVPAGFADWQYPLPVSGLVELRIEMIDPPQLIDGELVENTRPITIHHIVTVGLFNGENITNIINEVVMLDGGSY